ncbi:MAG: membrane protein insertase YidC [Candidatus Thiodiazotropha sp. (ex Codakia rugifera)]|nr:membrane protein insertase YidC [Candidatus Thiodiazotropha sp. (ex Codakia rugifera)]
MDNLRLILFFALAFVGLMLYQAWQQDYGTQTQNQPPQSDTSGGSVPAGDSTAIPVADVKADLPAAATPTGPESTGKEPVAAVIKVETDLLKLEISTQGGTVQKALLLDYLDSLERPDLKVELLSPREPNVFIAQSGLIGTEKGRAPSHEAIYRAEKGEYQLADGVDELVIPLVWSSGDGVEITKQFVLHRGSYLTEVRYLINNQSSEGWAARDYGQLQRMEPVSDSNGFTTYTYTGGVYYNPKEKYEKIDFDEMAKKTLNVESDQGWLAMIQHYFLSAWVPPKEQVEHYYTNSLSGGKYLIGSYSPSVTVAAGESKTLIRQLYIGPKLQDQLEAIAEGLELTVDYGWLTVIAKPIFWLLKTINDWVGNWGWSIIILTLLIKAAFFKLSETSYKSMANMRKFTPRIQAIKDRYGDDKQRVQAAMMELYKKEKINPLGGCLPIMVQIPVFIALYWVLLESVELRHAPWMLWIHSLSEKDPYFILPLIMGVSMFVQQKLNPAPPDPMQAKIMMTLPFVFTIFFAFFPAGLVLYWVVNNLVSIAQQAYITRKIEQSTN